MQDFGEADDDVDEVDATEPPIYLDSISRRLIIGWCCSRETGDGHDDGGWVYVLRYWDSGTLSEDNGERCNCLINILCVQELAYTRWGI